MSDSAVVNGDIFSSKGLKTLKWFVWKAGWPASVLFLLYPLHSFVMADKHPFAHAFGHGDYLLLSFVLLLETALDSEHLRHNRIWLEIVRQMSMWIALVLTVLFVASKYDVLVTLPSIKEEAVRWQRLHVYAQLNCWAVVIAVALGLSAFYSACEAEDELALRKATE